MKYCTDGDGACTLLAIRFDKSGRGFCINHALKRGLLYPGDVSYHPYVNLRGQV